MNRLLQREIGKIIQIITEYDDDNFNAIDAGITEDEAEMVVARFVKRIEAQIDGNQIGKILQDIREEE